jgi:uncharacterized membrane protein
VIRVVRLRQIADRIGHSLSAIPTMYVLGAIALVQASLWIDRVLSGQLLPDWLETTVESARAVFAAIAGGLITSTTLLLSMTLVAVQLASSQFSPRTLRNWLGNRNVQNAVGFVLGATVFCLLALRSTRDFEEDETPVIPHVTVLVAVALGVLSLVAVVRTVDHISQTMRVGSIAERVTSETIPSSNGSTATMSGHSTSVWNPVQSDRMDRSTCHAVQRHSRRETPAGSNRSMTMRCSHRCPSEAPGI